MHELFELVKKDPETWTPISKLGPVMRLSGEPQVGTSWRRRAAAPCSSVPR